VSRLVGQYGVLRLPGRGESRREDWRTMHPSVERIIALKPQIVLGLNRLQLRSIYKATRPASGSLFYVNQPAQSRRDISFNYSFR